VIFCINFWIERVVKLRVNFFLHYWVMRWRVGPGTSAPVAPQVQAYVQPRMQPNNCSMPTSGTQKVRNRALSAAIGEYLFMLLLSFLFIYCIGFVLSQIWPTLTKSIENILASILSNIYNINIYFRVDPIKQIWYWKCYYFFYNFDQNLPNLI